ncbi:MAG: hypothetical protein WC552_02450 [Candidatus Omnitrophota bacterium]
MSEILSIFLLFIVSVFLHVFWCRARKAKDLQIRPFLFLAIGVILLYIFLKPAPPDGIGSSPMKASNAPVYFSSLMLYVLLIPTYLIFYFGMNVESPSRRILVEVEGAGQMTYEEISAVIDNDLIISPRLNDLLKHGYLTFEGDAYRLTPSGMRVAQILDLYQRITGREMGG